MKINLLRRGSWKRKIKKKTKEKEKETEKRNETEKSQEKESGKEREHERKGQGPSPAHEECLMFSSKWFSRGIRNNFC